MDFRQPQIHKIRRQLNHLPNNYGTEIDATPQEPVTSTTTTQTNESETVVNATGVWLLAILLLFLSALFLILVLHMIYRRRRQTQVLFMTGSTRHDGRWQWFWWLGHSRNSSIHLTKTALSKERIEKRYETIEAWMIHKRVLPHDSFCQDCLVSLANQYKANPDQEGYSAFARSDNSKNNNICTKTNTNTKANTCTKLSTTCPRSVVHRPEQQNETLKSSENAVANPPNIDLEEPPPLVGAGDVPPNEPDQNPLYYASSGPSTCTAIGKTDHYFSCGLNHDEPQHSQSLECPICFEEFQVGDVVSFSPNAQECCSHVFHHGCIKEWLLRHTTCPVCRKICIPTDQLRSLDVQQEELKLSQNNNKEDLIARHKSFLKKEQMQHGQRNATTLYCVQNGLLALPPKINCTDVGLEEILHRLRNSLVQKEWLQQQRNAMENVGCSGGSSKSSPQESNEEEDTEPEPVVSSDERDAEDVELGEADLRFESDQDGPRRTEQQWEALSPPSSSNITRNNTLTTVVSTTNQRERPLAGASLSSDNATERTIGNSAPSRTIIPSSGANNESNGGDLDAVQVLTHINTTCSGNDDRTDTGAIKPVTYPTDKRSDAQLLPQSSSCLAKEISKSRYNDNLKNSDLDSKRSPLQFENDVLSIPPSLSNEEETLPNYNHNDISKIDSIATTKSSNKIQVPVASMTKGQVLSPRRHSDSSERKNSDKNQDDIDDELLTNCHREEETKYNNSKSEKFSSSQQEAIPNSFRLLSQNSQNVGPGNNQKNNSNDYNSSKSSSLGSSVAVEESSVFLDL